MTCGPAALYGLAISGNMVRIIASGFMTAADERKRQDDQRQREAWRPSRLHLLAIAVAAVLAIAALAAVIRHSLNEWACKMNWSTPCASGAPLDLSPPKPGPKRLK
jgi:hypothetical protein